MDTTFWDDDEDRVQIVYQNDQLPPAHAPNFPAAVSRPLFDLRDRLAEAQLTAAEGPSSSHHQKLQQEKSLTKDSQLHQYATQALEAAAAHADGPKSPPLLHATAITPQPARTGTPDASSSHQPERHHSFSEQHDVGGIGMSARLLSQAQPGTSSKINSLFSQAAAPQYANQPAQKQVHSSQTPGFHVRSKKHHPLYTPASISHHKSLQQKKPRTKAGGGFAIRQPTPVSAAAAKKPMSTTDALRQLVSVPHHGKPALHQGQPSQHESHAGVQPQRPGSIAQLLGIAGRTNPEEHIEDMGAEELHSPDQYGSDSAKDLLDSMLEGRLSQARERQMLQGLQHPATPPWTPAVRGPSTAHDGTVTPGMTLQQQFIASLQDTPAVPTSRITSGRSQAAPGTLTARLNRIVQLAKAQQAQFEATGSLGRQSLDVTITEHQSEGHIVKCRCFKENNEAEQVFVMFNSKMCRDVGLSAGCQVTLHAPWTDLQLPECSIPVILCQFVSAHV